MATSLETKVLFEPVINDLPKLMPYFPKQELQPVKPKSGLQKQKNHNYEAVPAVRVKPEIKPATRKNYSKLTLSLISASFFLLAGEALIYFHSVQVQKNSNFLQSNIIEMKEQNYRLNVELAKTSELSKVEEVAQEKLQMKPSLTAKINYLILPEQVVSKEYLVTKVFPAPKKLSIPIGY
jgi:cell division protein FtsL